MLAIAPSFALRYARGADDLAAVQRLRYEVFAAELGAAGPGICHVAQREADAFDPFASHLMLEDLAGDRPHLAGVYRIMDRTQAAAAGGFSSAAEFDLGPLIDSGRPLLELGRSCLRPAYRGGRAMHVLWAGLAAHIRTTGAEVLFGAASFAGTDPDALSGPLQMLMADHLAPSELRTRAWGPGAVRVTPAGQGDRKAALRATPPLIKAYLRIGGVVGQDAYVDRHFGTTDVCMILDVTTLPPQVAAQYGRHGDLGR
ncbi:GNAT family N-acetyltransferase [Loktanella sp. TSTF-M6]|uniref:L-ornithine N(alpha)-acyltransferase n=1 Tax=Loktanella gaetbuli TaxID=2881335 RepID=A0ABS8BQF2_9RHOB|nr:GNAT family N-acyltransferase [Loktanella gaetbuli]MCB5197953.1 GNAT family N-acetyltransferase [Loktanella gaetbuli]